MNSNSDFVKPKTLDTPDNQDKVTSRPRVHLDRRPETTDKATQPVERKETPDWLYHHIDAFKLLRLLRKNGPWTLLRIVPERGPPIARPMFRESDVHDFLAQYDGKQNLYYAVNPLRAPMAGFIRTGLLYPSNP